MYLRHCCSLLLLGVLLLLNGLQLYAVTCCYLLLPVSCCLVFWCFEEIVQRGLMTQADYDKVRTHLLTLYPYGGTGAKQTSVTYVSLFTGCYVLQRVASEHGLCTFRSLVILVGHDFGGTCISYAMELFPHRVSKAVYVAATMLTSGQSTLDMFSQKAYSNDLMRQAQIFLYANGNTQPPTAINLDKSLLRDLLFNQSPAKDVALASVSMRPIPFAPVLEKLSLSEMKYGSVRQFYIETPEDNAISITAQESMINKSPPEQVFRLKAGAIFLKLTEEKNCVLQQNDKLREELVGYHGCCVLAAMVVPGYKEGNDPLYRLEIFF
ncbi:hypothetical protein LOK49_LG13G00186 [Camellia lanceoleosa]|uniref:Uncharacterized protein n=1 Tax=Camellia lanceoleosa TaxID=1840588 RepID=A0ACC0FGU0_9ERIC|nr:hypothetical protein LOK49_LG13G00186 [Camellia lanceoleosa]